MISVFQGSSQPCSQSKANMKGSFVALEFGRIYRYLAGFTLFAKSKQKSSGSLCYRSNVRFNTIQHQP